MSVAAQQRGQSEEEGKGSRAGYQRLQRGQEELPGKEPEKEQGLRKENQQSSILK